MTGNHEIVALESAEMDGDGADVVELERVWHDERYHLTLLIPSVIVLLLSVVMSVRSETAVVIPLLNTPLPEVCSFRRMFQMDCPGCGLTRCFISMGHGQVRRAFEFNPVGVGFFLVVAGQIPYRLTQIVRLRRGLPEWSLGWFGYSLLVIVSGALLVQWIIKLTWMRFG
ncbi:MAG: DUF2752 domain-containing protein [Planctomycetales bacterium]|nr:DUF2752 domain-containing protein [Planctomycetales bacterium]MCA9225711.1 DUF2752 domain-containing protein [Planctomycetales bacterium]